MLLRRFTNILFLLSVFNAGTCAAQIESPDASITVIRANTKKPLPDAIIKIAILNSSGGKAKEVYGFTNAKGVFDYTFTEPVTIQVSHFGYNTITDTLYQLLNKTYEVSIVSQNIQDVVITGQSDSNSVRKSMYDVKIIDAEMLRAKGANNLREALQNELSIDLGEDQVFGSYLGINGISGEGVKIMVDGVPLIGRSDGKLDLSEISLNDIDHIEIVEGPLSVIYGTDAMGGVINLVTKTSQSHKIDLSVRGYYESVGQYNAEVNAGFSFKRSRIFLSAGRNFFGGYSPIDTPRYKEWFPKEQYFGSVKYIYFTERLRLTFAGSFFRELMIDRSPPDTTILIGNSGAYFAYLGYDVHYLTYKGQASASLSYRFKKEQQLDVLLGYSGYLRYIQDYTKNLVTGTEQIVPDPSVQDTTHYTQLTGRAIYTIPAWKNRLLFQSGVDIDQEFTTDNIVGMGEKRQYANYAAFESIRITLAEGLDIQPAARINYNTRFSVPVIPSFNIRYNYKDKLLVRASYGRGYRAPSLKELYLSFFDSNHALKGNPDLKPEDGNCVNASLSYTQHIKKHQLTFAVSGFYNNISNEIDWALFEAPIPPDTYQYFNLKHYVTYGGDAAVTYAWESFHVSVSPQLTAYHLTTAGVDSAVKMWSPDLAVSAGYIIPKAEIGINVTYKYTGVKPFFSVNSSIQTGTRDAYSMLNITLMRNFWKDRIQLTVGGKNLLNVKDVVAVNMSGVGHNLSGDATSIGWGRTVFVTLVLHYFSK